MAMESANLLHGTIISGDRIGRTLGFPTANLQTADELPEDGVYVARMDWDSGSGYGMLNIGTRPTVNGNDRRAEMHLLHFKGNLYGKTVCVKLLHRIRKEIRFADTAALREQMVADRRETEEFLLEKHGIRYEE